MKLGFLMPSGLGALLLLTPSPRADEMRLDEVVAHTARDLVVRSPWEDNPLLELVHRAQLAATGAEVSLGPPLPAGTRIAGGPVTVGAVLGLARRDARIATLELSGAALEEVLERSASRFAPYTYEDGRPLLAPGAGDTLLDTTEGVSFELDLTRPEGDRVIHLAIAGRPLDPARRLKVAVTEERLGRGDLGRAAATATVWLKDALLEEVRRRGTLDGGFDHNWSLLPDYVTTRERPLVDRLVRLGAVPAAEVHRLFPDQPARRGDLAYWLARAFGWREVRLSGAFPDVPDSLEPWLDGLLKRRVLGAASTEEFFQPFATVRLPVALDWCENAARVERYALDTARDVQAFRRGLLTGSNLQGGRWTAGDTVTRGQLLAIISNARFPTLRVLGTSDFHGAMLPRNLGGRPRGGSAVLASHLKRLRDENPEGTVLLDGGDMFQGTMIANLAYGRPVVEQMNLLEYAAAAIGNHEFDWGTDTLARRVAEMRFAALGANLVERASGKRPSWARSDTSFTRRGVRVAVLGLCYPATPASTHPRNVATLRFDDDSATAAKLVPRSRARSRAEVMIGLAHVPATQDSAGSVEGGLARLAGGVRSVDLWLGGHSHTRVAGEVGGVPVLVPGSHGEAIGVCDLVVDPVRDRVVERRVGVETTWADAVTPDSAMGALVERWNREVEREAAVLVGLCARRLTKSRGGESPVGSLVADVMRAATQAEIALQNNGGLRGELPEGPVTRGAIYEVLPFENTIVTMELTGAEVRRVLEESIASEKIIQVSGIRYRFDLGRPAGARVTALFDHRGSPLEEARTYKVVCNDFMAHGGDDLVTLTRGRNRYDTDIGLRQALEDWVRARAEGVGTLDYQGDGRVMREPGSRPPARGE